jgi:site-specific recombinase XerD
MTPSVIPNSKNNARITPMTNLVSVPEELLWRANFNSDQSIATYDDAIQQFMQFLQINTPEELRQVTHAHVIAFKQHLQALNKKPSTINNRLSAISSLFNHLIDKQICTINPAQGVRRMKAEYGQVKSKCLTAQEGRRLLDVPNRTTLKGKRDYAILAMLFYTGCRISEVCKLKVSDFFMEKGYRVLEFQLKGGKRNRVAISKELELAVLNYMNACGHGEEKEQPLFQAIKHSRHKDTTRHLSRINLYQLWRTVCESAGIEGASPHSARTTFITEAMENNCPIEAVQKTVGHAQIKTTQMYDKRNKQYKDSASFSVRF